jgi:tripartite-type tricarboxylate transporter receptor subunit TctC
MRCVRVWVTAVLLLAAAARAQELPDQPIRVIVPYSAGSSLDARARVVSEAVGQRIKRRVIVENRPGAGGTLGTLYVARAKPDGGTLLFTNNSHVVSPHVYREAGYDPIADLAPVAQAYTTGLVLVAHPSLRVSSVKELVALLKAGAASPAYASSGTGGLPHLAMEMFMRAAGIELVHVAYRGDAQGLTDVLAGRVQVMISGYPAAQPHVRAGTLRPLAVTSSARTDIFPGAPTLAEAGYPAATLDAWAGYFAPPGMPRGLLERLNRDIAAALAQPSIQAHFAATGAAAAGGTPQDFAAIVKREWELYGKLVRELKLQPQ